MSTVIRPIMPTPLPKRIAIELPRIMPSRRPKKAISKELVITITAVVAALSVFLFAVGAGMFSEQPPSTNKTQASTAPAPKARVASNTPRNPRPANVNVKKNDTVEKIAIEEMTDSSRIKPVEDTEQLEGNGPANETVSASTVLDKSKYSIESYEVQERGIGIYEVAYTLVFKIKGEPGVRLAAVLIGPDGERVGFDVIEDVFWRNRFATVFCPLDEFPAGNYTLSLRTINLKDIYNGELVCQKTCTFTSSDVKIKDVEFELDPFRSARVAVSGFTLSGAKVTIQKQGDLPIKIWDISVEIDGEQSFMNESFLIEKPNSQKVVEVGLMLFRATESTARNLAIRSRNRLDLPWAVFFSGDRYPARIRIFCSEDRTKYVDYNTELVVR